MEDALKCYECEYYCASFDNCRRGYSSYNCDKELAEDKAYEHYAEKNQQDYKREVEAKIDDIISRKYVINLLTGELRFLGYENDKISEITGFIKNCPSANVRIVWDD